MTRSSENTSVKPAYFPFTCISAEIARRLFSSFGGAIVYQPGAGGIPAAMRPSVESGKIEIRMPVQSDAKRLEKLSASLKNWGRLHEGQGRVFKERLDAGFFHREFTARIRSEILEGSREPAVEKDSLFSARLFLVFAQAYDMEQAEIDQRLHTARVDHLKLFSGLKGEIPTQDPSVHPLPVHDTGEYMTASRVFAWLKLMQADPDKSPVWITGSRPCFYQMLEYARTAGKVCPLEETSYAMEAGDPDSLMTSLLGLAQVPWKSFGPEPLRIGEEQGKNRIFSALSILPGVSPDSLAAGRHAADTDQRPGEFWFRNTLIGLINI